MDAPPVAERPRRQRRSRQQQNGGPLPGLGGANQAGDLVQNTAGNAVNGATGSAGKAVGGVLGGNSGKEEKEEGKDEQLRLRLDLNLDIEVQLKAKIHGDLTLGLLSVLLSPSSLSFAVLVANLVFIVVTNAYLTVTSSIEYI